MPKSRKKIINKIVFNLIFLSLSVSGFSQSQTVDQIIEKLNTWDVFYLYPSTLRMLNPENNPSYNQLIYDVEKVKILILDQEKHDIPSIYDELIAGLDREHFETLMEMDEQDNAYRIFGYTNPKGEISDFVGIVRTGNDSQLVFEVEGELNMPAALDLMKSGFNTSAFSKLIIREKEKKEKEQQQNSKN